MSLKNLLALQAQKKASEAASQPKAAPTESPAPTEPAKTEESAAPAKPKGLGLNILSAAKQVSNLPAVTPKVPLVEADEIFSLDDIAAMDQSATPARRETQDSGFLDEIEATAPDRDLPEDLIPQQLQFVESLDGIYQVLHDPEMFSQSVRIIMMELQENPEYIKLVSDPDVHTMIRGMRNSMGLARVKKQEKQRKTGNATKAKARKTSAELDSAMALLNALGGDDD